MIRKEKKEKKEKIHSKKSKNANEKNIELLDDNVLLKKAHESSTKDEEEKDSENVENFADNDSEVKLYMIDFSQCDPKKCSGRKLENFNLLKSINHKNRFRGITLSAKGTKYVSKEDRDIIVKYGLCVIDCSWNKIEELNVKTKFDHERILPFMVAVNPINFGAPYKLSCAEALAAGLAICDFWEQGQALLEKFKWGPGFWKLNEEAFSLYEKCNTLEELKDAESEYLTKARSIGNKKQRSLPPSSSESENDSKSELEPEENDDSNESN